MNLLGCISKNNNILSSMDLPDISTIEIKKKNQIEDLDGVVIFFREKNDLELVIEWLLICQEKKDIFIWIFSDANLDIDTNILMKLGANFVLFGEKKFNQLESSIQNTFAKLNFLIKKVKFDEEDSLKETNIVNAMNQSVVVNGIEVGLTKKEFIVFNILFENKDNCISYSEIYEKVWPSNVANDIEKYKYLVTNTIFHLRSKLDVFKNINIRTIRSRGYILSIKNK